jgi:hypothetical protein
VVDLITAVSAGLALFGVSLIGNDKERAGPSRPTLVCSVTGSVRDSDNNKPAAAVDVGSVPPGTPHNRPDQFRAIVTSGPRGEFSFDCAEADGHDRFFALEGPWGVCLALTRIALPSSPGKHQRTPYFSGAAMDAISFHEGDPMNPCGG